MHVRTCYSLEVTGSQLATGVLRNACERHAGTVSSAGACCALGALGDPPPTLDSAGRCCAGTLDACGICGGSGRSVNLSGACCQARPTLPPLLPPSPRTYYMCQNRQQ